MNKSIFSLFALVLTLLFVSCSGNVPPMQRDYVDAVTNINQVDPYYRAFFRSQNGSNYTLADQRRAYLAAMQTARTPVRASDYTRGVAEARNKALAQRRAAAHRRASIAAKGKKKVSPRRRAVAKGKTKVRRGAKARNGRATAARRPARRGARRRG